MYNLSGIAYRIWGVCGIISLMCLITVITSIWNEKKRKEIIIVCVVAFLYCCIDGFNYFSILQNPDIQVFEGAYCEGYRDSRVAPPLPFTSCYRFVDTEGNNGNFYLDTFAKKEIYYEDFVVGDLYRVYYESETDIIVKIDHIYE